MSFFKSPLSPLARIRRNPSSPFPPSPIPTVDKENVVPLVMADLKISDGEAKDKVVVLEACNRDLAAKVGTLQAQVETFATSSVTCGLGGPMFGRKTIRALERDILRQRQELIRLEQELQCSAEESANVAAEKEEIMKQSVSAKESFEANQKSLRAEIEQLNEQAKVDKEQYASLERKIADLQAALDHSNAMSSDVSMVNNAAISVLEAKIKKQESNLNELNTLHEAAKQEIDTLKARNIAMEADHNTKVLALQDALKAKEMELHKSSHSFLDTMRSPFHNLMPHHGNENSTSKSTTDFKKSRPEFLSPVSSVMQSQANSNENNSDAKDPPNKTPKAVSHDVTVSPKVDFNMSGDGTNPDPSRPSYPLTPMPSAAKKRSKTPLSLLKSAGGSIRRSARKSVKTRRFSPEKKE